MLAAAAARVETAMRALVIAWWLLSGCTTMTLRTGMFVAGGKPAFQASIEIGPSVYRKHVGVSGTTEFGVHTDGRGAKPLLAMNLDALVLARSGDDADDGDDDRHRPGPVVRTGVRFRGVVVEKDGVERDESNALLVRGAAYTTVERDRRGVTACGIEIAGGVETIPRTMPAFEANLVVTGRWGLD